MLENAIYSILSPEGFASILWKDSSRAQEAAEKMKLTAQDLYKLGVIDKIIKENKDNSGESFKKTAKDLKKNIESVILEMSKMTKEQIVEDRYNKFRKMGNTERMA